MTSSILAWHFAPADMRCWNDRRRIQVGHTLTVKGPPRLCYRGLHASIRLIDALNYAPEATRLCRVRIGGEIDFGDDKLAGTRRAVLWALTEAQTNRLFRIFACDVAERRLRVAGVKDERSWRAVRVSRLYAAGMATEAELAFARREADCASMSHNRFDAWVAARDACQAAAACAIAASCISAPTSVTERDVHSRLLARRAQAMHRKGSR
jgi:hypothetical protein